MEANILRKCPIDVAEEYNFLSFFALALLYFSFREAENVSLNMVSLL